MLILIEDSFNRLLTNTNKNFDKSREENSRRVQVFTTAFIPAINNNSLEVRAKTKTNNETYDSIIYFEDVQFVDELDNNSIDIKGTDGSDYYILPIDSNKNVKVNCSCLDFYFRFSKWNGAKSSLFGKTPPPYIRKRDSNRGPVNPSKSPGVCKHLIKLFEYLKKENLLK